MLGTSVAPWPSFTDEEIDAVARVLRSNRVNYWTGEECRAFEHEFAEYVGAEYAIALANGTLALEVALEACGVGPNDDVVTAPRTFVASASAAVRRGARPVFADVDSETQTITADSIAAAATSNTRAVIAVHLAGQPCDMDPIMQLAASRGWAVIEDCAQAHGARYRGRSVGSMGHIGAWSFCQDKIMSTGGEGGMVTTNDENLWRSIWALKDHGKAYQAVYEREHPPGFRWLHESFGSNYRMTEMQATIGRLQLGRLPEWREARAQNAARIFEVCEMFTALRVLRVPGGITHAHYKAYVFVRPGLLKAGWNRDRIASEIQALGIPCLTGSCSEVYLEKAFENTHWQPQKRLPVAQELGATSLMFLVHPTLTEDDLQRTCDAITQVMATAQR